MANEFETAQELLEEVDRMSRFSARMHAYPYQKAEVVVQQMEALANSMVPGKTLDTNAVLARELKRRLLSEARLLQNVFENRAYTFDTVLDAYNIPRSDIDALEPWLRANKARVEAAVERLYSEMDVSTHDLTLPLDIPRVKADAEALARIELQKHHRHLGVMLERLTDVGSFIPHIEVVSSTQGRSYFHPVTKTVALAVDAICYLGEDRGVRLRERDLLRLYGHEGMGHALNYVVTEKSDLPFAIRRSSGTVVEATMESVAQHYERQLLEDLEGATDIQRELGIHHDFASIHQEAIDYAAFSEYRLKFAQYALTVLADTSMGDQNDPHVLKRKIEILDELSLDRNYARSIVEQNRHNYDLEGNLNPRIVSELRYAADPVGKVMEAFAEAGLRYDDNRSLIDRTILTGFWTPEGMVEYARLQIKKAKE